MNFSLDKIINKAFRWLTIIVLLLSVVSLSFVLMNTSGFLPASTKIKFINDTPEIALGGVQGENLLTQTFTAKTPIQAIGIKMATYNRDNPGEVSVRVLNQDKSTVIYQKVVPANQIRDNSFNEFRFSEPIPGNGKAYVIEVSGSTPDILQSIGVWCSYTDVYPDGHLTVSEVDSEGDMLFYLVGTTVNNTLWPILLSASVTVVILALILAWMLFFHRENKVTAKS